MDNESVTASYDKGLLKISLGKRADAKPKQIKVNIGKELSAPRSKPHKRAASLDVVRGDGAEGLVSPDFYEAFGGGCSSALIKTGERFKLRFTNHGHSMGQING